MVYCFLFSIHEFYEFYPLPEGMYSQMDFSVGVVMVHGVASAAATVPSLITREHISLVQATSPAFKLSCNYSRIINVL